MTARAVRRVVVAVCAAGIAGMIVSSVTEHDGAAVTFGLITTAAVLCLVVATAVSRATPAVPAPDEAQAAVVEDRVRDLVAGGADETAVRALVGEAVRLGRGERPRLP
ncbi:MAG TPA: hypothetical protein VFJ85_04475 [Acidimicrobiales bacterium]|nr:hypothetical protein [Acidimicrobiales bacterium]